MHCASFIFSFILVFTPFIKARIKRIEILAVEAVGEDAQTLAEPLIVRDLALAKELEGFEHVGIVDEADKIIVGGACFLFGGKIFVQIRDGVAF